MPPFKKVLIANRGEIAVRIVRACRDMGITSVAVFSEADRCALHVRLADEAVAIGPSPAQDSYLNMQRILEAAAKIGADAVHPGYGFLAENADFAEACSASGCVWIGPNPASMRRMGNKTAARLMLQEMGLPVVPGTATPLDSLERARQIAADIGYPVMLKAAAGGGGKGMRTVSSPEELPGAFATARSEAKNAFGDDSVYLEKFFVDPRHIEIQVMGDQHGHVIHLAERECSIQRRHQKLIEESPSPFLDQETRQRMGAVAVAAARQAGYDNAGTVEFLVDANRGFYFLEMNTRLQVEHPVTEMTTGIDLVRLQFHIAAGKRLELKQEDVRHRGASIECRLYAEDPLLNFFPCPGVIRHLVEPSGTGVRVDSGVYQGFEVPVDYDSLVAKLITWGQQRQEAIDRMQRALGEYRLGGIRSTLPLFVAIMTDSGFRAGNYNTNFLKDRVETLMQRSSALDGKKALLAAVSAHHMEVSNGKEASRKPALHNPWKHAGRQEAMRRR